MIQKQEHLEDLFHRINHSQYKLTKDEILTLLELVKQDKKDKDLVGLSILCLSYGSYYIDNEEPELFKTFFNNSEGSFFLGEVFEGIRMTGMFDLYLEEIKQYSMFKNWDFDEFEANAGAVEALSNYVFNEKSNVLYRFLTNQYEEALENFLENKYDDEDDILFALRKYISAIYFSNEGVKSYTRRTVSIEDIRENRILINQELSGSADL